MNFIAWMPIFAAVVALAIYCLWHLVRNEPRFIPKWGWAMLIVLTAPVGSIIYILVEVLDAGITRSDAEGRTPQQE